MAIQYATVWIENHNNSSTEYLDSLLNDGWELVDWHPIYEPGEQVSSRLRSGEKQIDVYLLKLETAPELKSVPPFLPQ